MARHKKTRKTRRRRSMRGGTFPFTRLDGTPWLTPAPVQTLELPPAKMAKTVAPMVPSPSDQAAALGTVPGGTVSTGAPILGSTAATPLPPSLGGRRRTRRRKTRRRH